MDGGLTPHNNPSLQMLMLARMAPYGLDWQLGKNQLQLISIGRGTRRPQLNEPGGWIEKIMPEPVWFAYRSLLGLSRDCSVEAVKIMQWLSEPEQPWHINNELRAQVGDLLLSRSHHDDRPELLRFQRYDMELPIELDNFIEPDVMADAYELATEAAQGDEVGVKTSHFPLEFNLSRQRLRPPQSILNLRIDSIDRATTPFIVGVSCEPSQRLSSSEVSRIKSQLQAAFAELEALSHMPFVTMMSALGEGGEQLMAELALARGWQLITHLPALRQTYEGAFSDATAKSTFEQLCSRSVTVLEFKSDGAEYHAPSRSPQHGQAVVSAARAMIVIWSDEVAPGMDSTAEVIARAVAKRIPVYWIDPTPGSDLKRL